MLFRKSAATIAILLGALTAYACSSDDTDPSPATPVDGGGGGTDGGGTEPAKSGGFQITVSGEDLAVNGYDFAAGAKADDDPPPFVDGWEVRFTHVIVTVDKIRLNEDPDKDPGDPQTLGAQVAEVDGPFAVDAHIGGPITGKSGGPDEKTVAIASINTKSDGTAFDTASRYGFSYDLVPASANAKIVNLDDEGKALYEQGKTKGWSMIYAGVATYKGAAPAAGSVFEKIPTVVNFTLGMKNPSSYVNCQNTDLNQLPSGEFPRGVQPDATKATTAQITIHTDHGFWSKLNIEGTELHFDPIAAHASTYGTADAGPGTVTLEDLVSVDVTAFKTKNDEPLPGRSLVTGYTAPAGTLSYDQNGTTLTPTNSFAAYLQYSAASGGHLNADGECEVKNNFTP